MANTIARGQISFIDLNDGRNISLYLTSNRPLTQLYDVDAKTYAPDYTQDNLVITPNVFVSGLTGNRINQAPVWTINGQALSSFASGVSASSSYPYALTISKNSLVNSDSATTFMTIQCSTDYNEADTGLSTPVTAQITITKQDTTGELIHAVAYANGSTIFHNVDTEGAQSVVLHCDFWRGASIDDQDVTYQWYRKDNPDGADAYDWHKIVTSFSGTGGAAATGTLHDGSTWAEVLKHNLSGYTSNELTVTSGDILNYDAFMCVCTDTDDGDSANGIAASATYGTSVRSDTVTILDWSDPYSLDFKSVAGTTMTRGTTSLSTTVSVWQKGQELPASVQNSFEYVWTKANKDGIVAQGVKIPGSAQVDPDDYKASNNNDTPTADSSWQRQNIGGTTVYCRKSTGTNGGRNLTVYHKEVAVKSTFFVEVIIP